MEEDTVEEFAVTLEELVEDRLGRDPGWLRRDAFVDLVGGYLTDDGTLEDLNVCFYNAPAGRRMMQVAGYAISDGGRVLDLVVALYGYHGETIPREQALRRLRWAYNFATRCRDGLHLDLEESSPAYDMAQIIYSSWQDFDKIRLFLFTDGRTTIENLGTESIDGKPVIQDLWDIERIRRLVTSGRQEEAITIDLNELGSPLRCLPTPSPQNDYQCFLTVIPGKLLADLYERHGSKLLQRNVRAFLQIRGKVNKKINETIRTAPDHFLAYNNGISATATSVTLDERADGTFLTHLTDLQIVNGGQTTASLHYAAVRDRADLSKVQVAAKLTVVAPDQLDQLVPKISRYANSQNKINEADFESTSPFHIELERLSRTIWAPAALGSTRQTRWYYERVRGQYQVERARRKTRARQRAFDEENPRSQRFTKTDAAKYEMTFRQAPHIVSLGGQKCFQRWTYEVLSARTSLPDEAYFRNLVAKAIFFERARREIQRANPGAGYLANVTTYTIARMVEGMDTAAVLATIWREQAIPEHVLRAVIDLSGLVREVLMNAPGSRNVTEWCKKEDCWKKVLDIPWSGL